MAETTTPLLCPYCRLNAGEYFTPNEIGKMKPYCTSYDCEVINCQ